MWIDQNEELMQRVRERNARIRFFDEGHIYTIDGVSDPLYISVTGLKSVAIPFRGGGSVAMTTAAQQGTMLHRAIESAIVGDHVHEENMPDVVRHHFDHWRANWEKVFNKTFGEWKVLQVEWPVFIESPYFVQGTIDLVIAFPDGTVGIVDWKRSRSKLKFTVKPRHTFGTSQADGYALQQNLYRFILETSYGFKVRSMHLCIINDDGMRLMRVPHLDLASLLNHRSAIVHEREELVPLIVENLTTSFR